MNLKNFFLLITALMMVLIMIAAFGDTAFVGEQVENQNLSSPTPEPSKSISLTPTLTPSPTEISQADYNAETQRLFNHAFGNIELIRNVTLPQIDIRVVSKDWSIQNWGVSIANADLVGIKRQENIYKALMMLPQNASLYQATVDWAGYFMAVVQSGTIYLVQENFNITNIVDAEATLVHELTHILQSSYNIPQYYYEFDGNKARTALIEGDATFTASYIKNQTLSAKTPNPESIFPVLKFIVINNPNMARAVVFFPSIPDSVYNLDYFPYKYGEKFIQALYENGGWKTINQAYKHPPNSTEQILHPEKYFNAEPLLVVGSEAPKEGNWTKTYSNQYGEFFIQNMLSTNLTQNEAQKAAVGWGTDKLAYFENSNNQYLLTWNIKWDSYNDAGKFFLAFNNYMRNAGAQETQFSQWQTNQVYQKIDWNQNTNTTLIIATTDPTAINQFP